MKLASTVREERYSDIHLENTSLSLRVRTALYRTGIYSVTDLVRFAAANHPTEIHHIGAKGASEIQEFIHALNSDPDSVINLAIELQDQYGILSELQRNMTVRELEFLGKFTIADSPLTVRTRNALQRAGLVTVNDILEHVRTGEIDEIRNIGEVSLAEIGEYIGSFVIEDANQISITDTARGPTAAGIVQSLANFPVSLYSTLASKRIHEKVIRSGAPSAGQFIDILLSDESEGLELAISDLELLKEKIRRLNDDAASSALRSLLSAHTGFVRDRLDRGWIHPEVRWAGEALASWLKSGIQNADSRFVLRTMCDINDSPSIAYELEGIFSIPERDVRVFIGRFGPARKTLEAVGNGIGVTRERARQIEYRLLRNIWGGYRRNAYLLLKSALLFARDLDADLCFDVWIEGLQSSGSLGAVDIHHPLQSMGFTPDDALIALINSSRKQSNARELVPENLVQSVRNPGLPVSAIHLLENVSSVQRRKIFRKIGYTGGIHLDEAKQIIPASEDTLRYYLASQSLIEIDPDWYSFSSPSQHKKCPINKTGLKLSEACGPLDFQSFCDGIRRKSARFFPALAPIGTVKHLLRVYGFVIEDDRVMYPERIDGNLAESEKIFLQVIERYGPVVSLYETAELFEEAGMSVPAVIVTLGRSPITDQYERGLYILRGYKPTWDDLEQVRGRRELVSGDTQVTYGTDATIRYQITVSQYGSLTGVLNSYDFPDLGGKWRIFVGAEAYGTARMDENFIWGFNQAFSQLDVEPGDRIELEFEIRNELVKLRKSPDES